MKQQSAYSYPTDIFKQTTPDESQDVPAPIWQPWYKGYLTGSEIYERMLPDGEGKCLRIDGPGESAFYLDQKGRIKLLGGQRNKELGPDSGKLDVKCAGSQVKFTEPSNFVFEEGESEDGQALNVLCYGDYVEESKGSERHIKAQKIIITATEELMLIGGTQVNIQAGSTGGGTISMSAGTIEQVADNSKETIIGQKMTYGVAEDTKVSFDPRASVNVVSPGHINHKILGDLKTWVGGIEQRIIAGGPAAPPLIQDRATTYSMEATLGNVDFTSVAGLMNLTSGTITNITAGGAMNITATGNVNIKGATIFLN